MKSQQLAPDGPTRVGGPVVLITGAAGHVGAGLSRALASRGARLVVHDRVEAPTRAIADEVDANALLGDITVFGEAARIIEAVLDLHGEVDGIVNGAGIEGPIGPIEDASLDEVRCVFEVNVIAMIAMAQAVIPVMRNQRRGRIVNIASGAGLAGSAWMAPYSASKHAVVGLTRSIAREVADAGISVNAVCPGVVDSPMVDRIATRIGEIEGRGHAVSFMSGIPIGRYVRVEEVASLVTWLLLDAPSSFLQPRRINREAHPSSTSAPSWVCSRHRGRSVTRPQRVRCTT